MPTTNTLFCALALTLAPVIAQAEEVVVFAAASLTNALAEIETGFEAATGHDLVVSVGGAAALARQIQFGAPADIFISSSTDWMDRLERDGLLEPDSRFDLLGNTLVLIAHGAAPPVTLEPGFDLPGLLGGGRLAMALVDSVPAGVYGKQALSSMGLWTAVEPLVAQTENVRAALTLVAAGEAPFGIVYASDAASSPAVSVVATFPEGSHAPIVYPVADIANRDTEAEAAFLEYLRGPEARAVFDRHRFVVLVP